MSLLDAELTMRFTEPKNITAGHRIEKRAGKEHIIKKERKWRGKKHIDYSWEIHHARLYKNKTSIIRNR